MPALSWLHGSARLRRRRTRMAECDNSDEGGSVSNGGDGRGVGVGRGWRSGSAGGGAGNRKRGRRARVTAARHSPRLRWAMRVATMGVESAASVMQAAAEPGWLTRCGRWGGAGRMVETRACGKRTRPGPQGTKPVRPVRRPAARGTPRKSGQRWQHLRAMRDFRALDAKKGP